MSMFIFGSVLDRQAHTLFVTDMVRGFAHTLEQFFLRM